MNEQAEALGRPFTIPLSGSQYVFWFQELDTDPVEFSFDFVTSIPGDYNGDNFVNAADYTVWRNMVGQEVPSGTGADGDGNGFVDSDDYLLWRATYGMMVSPGSGASANVGTQVPEPNAMLASIVAAMLLLGVSGRHAPTVRRICT
jgi:hypothetical protein